MKQKRNHLLEVKAMSGRTDILPEVKLPRKRKKRAKETKPRNQPERDFRADAKDFLISKMCKVKRLENSICGENNRYFPDLWVVCFRTRWAGWVELKSKNGSLSPGQQEFREECQLCGVNHIVANKLDDLREIYT